MTRIFNVPQTLLWGEGAYVGMPHGRLLLFGSRRKKKIHQNLSLFAREANFNISL